MMLHQRLLIAGVVVALVAAACTTEDSSQETAAQVEAATQLADAVAELQATTADTEGELATVEERLGQAEADTSAFVASAETHALDRTDGIPDPPDGQIAIRLSFGYYGEAVPGDGLIAYEPDPSVSTVWAMESLDAGQPLPVGDPLAGNTFFMTPGDRVAVTVGYENPTDQEVSFMAVPHQDSPGSLNGLVWPQCLCFSFPYSAPANGSWYRVIEFGSSTGIPAGSKIDILWNFHTDPAVFPTE